MGMGGMRLSELSSGYGAGWVEGSGCLCLGRCLLLVSGIEAGELFLDHFPVVGIGGGKVAQSTLLDKLLRAGKVASNVVCQALALSRGQHVAEELPTLSEVILVPRLNTLNVARGAFDVPLGLWRGHGAAEAVGEVVRCASLVTVDSGRAVALVVLDLGRKGAVDRNGLVVDAKAVAVSVRVAKQAPLKHLVWRRLNARNHVRGGKGELLNLGKVVFRISVQGHAPNLQEGERGVGPDLCTKWGERECERV